MFLGFQKALCRLQEFLARVAAWAPQSVYANGWSSVGVYETFHTLTFDKRSLKQSRARQNVLNNALELENKLL